MSILDRIYRLSGLNARRSTHDVVLYGKPGCHLCEDARELLKRLERSYTFTVAEIDIRSDPALFRRYDIRIPVLLIDGQRELDAPIKEQQLRKLLA
jgi:glutaredoxin